ncbi:MAG TPA: OmpA family protein [Thermodesulfovibrionales bacterium]|nr:OmpA family protein [Thermodesulfovibrionales bacterium]
MKVLSLKSLAMLFSVLLLSFVFGCSTFQYAPKKNYIFYHKELPQAEQAVEIAAIAGKDKQCPDEFNEAKALMEKAYEVYWACRTQEAIAMAKDARSKALALCPPPPTCELTASPREVELEQSSTLTLKPSGKVKTAVLDGTAVSAAGGTKVVTPPNTMPYLAHVAGPGGSGTCSASVSVIIPPAPSCEISAEPAEIEQGQSSTLALKATGRVKSSVLDGTSVAPTGGTKTVSPSYTTSYLAQCSGPGGSTVRSTTVTVTPPPPPGCELSADPREIKQGESATLALKATGKVTSSILDATPVAPSGGTKTVTPSDSTVYVGQCSGPGGSSISTTTVSVILPPAPTCELNAEPEEVAEGQAATLTLKTTGSIKSAVLDGTQVAPTGATKTVTPKVSTLYNAQISGPGGSSMCTATVLVSPPPPPAVDLTASPKQIELGQSSSLTMKTGGKVTSAVLDGIATAPSGGTKSVSPDNTTTYFARASGPGGAAMSSATVTVMQPAAPGCALTAEPKEIEPGRSSTLTLKTSGKVKSAVLDGTATAAEGGTKSVSPKTTTPYIAQVSGPGGSTMCTATVSVTPPPPPPAPTVLDRMIIHVNFAFNKANITKRDRAELQRAINFVSKYPGAQITVEGHTDDIGTEEYNQRLSEARAAAVKEYLVKEGGIDGSKISTVGYGELKPVALNDTPEGRAANRRAEILIMSK